MKDPAVPDFLVFKVDRGRDWMHWRVIGKAFTTPSDRIRIVFNTPPTRAVVLRPLRPIQFRAKFVRRTPDYEAYSARPDSMAGVSVILGSAWDEDGGRIRVIFSHAPEDDVILRRIHKRRASHRTPDYGLFALEPFP
jgi:hypothetical protein